MVLWGSSEPACPLLSQDSDLLRDSRRASGVTVFCGFGEDSCSVNATKNRTWQYGTLMAGSLERDGDCTTLAVIDLKQIHPRAGVMAQMVQCLPCTCKMVVSACNSNTEIVG